MNKDKVLEWLRRQIIYEKEQGESQNKPDGYKLIHGGFEGGYSIMLEKIESGEFD